MLRINTPAIVHDFIEDEVIIVHLARGFYFSLSGLSALIWKAIEKQYSVDSISAELSSLYGISDLTSFISDLQEDDLVVLDESVSVESNLEDLRSLLSIGDDRTLKLNRYSDMQDFLLLDPVHDVGEGGWPHKN